MLFFFVESNSEVQRKYGALFNSRGNKGTSKSILTAFSWYLMKTNLAKEGIFTKVGFSALESVEKENLHNVLFYLNIKALEKIENEQ